MPDPQVDIDTIKEITYMFIEAGIHMDAVNVEGQTATQKCKDSCKHNVDCWIQILIWLPSPMITVSPLFAAYIKKLLRRYEFNESTLKCLSSRCIAQNRIPYKDVVPKQLEYFIQMHSADKI